MKRVFIFMLGAAAGSLVTWKIVEEKYKKIADEEITSVQEYYHNKLNTLDLENKVEKVEVYDTPIEHPEVKITVDEEDTELFTEEEKNEYVEQVKDLGYSEDGEATVVIKLPKEYTRPYIISPDEYGEIGYTTASLTLYSDGVLADDEDDEIISNPEDIIGDALNHFGEYEDDAIHVRDENIECDYEILKSEKSFSEVYKGDN